ncbi:hypothetical protein EJ08DRAFT_450310 [Tothia fuscella]|uniref:Uncharacterized protein n=1 Tax=Tothia fuscella TaxID=1048955 RepID=A0A9P4NIY0_9PEZI|nr:hypothetical protein EJ08DRAFT_450310 [Tothia fuscella]
MVNVNAVTKATTPHIFYTIILEVLVYLFSNNEKLASTTILKVEGREKCKNDGS